ncbi:MAG: ABC transporter substrate-binding protein [Promethearchaeati archaeon SRVP18_Atabeyarchaeia-1]
MAPMRIGHLSTAYHTAFVLMGAELLERKARIEASWRLFPTGPEMIKAFQREELDIGYIGLPPAMIGIEKGLKIKCIAGGHVEGTMMVSARRFIDLNALNDVKATLMQFKGKTIGTPAKGSIHDVIIRHLVEAAGLQDEIAVRNFQWADFILEAMEEKLVDAGCGTPPLAVLASRFLDSKIILPPHAMWAYSPSYGIVAAEHVIHDSPDTLDLFLRLHEDACNLIRLKPLEAAKMGAHAIGLVKKDFLLDVFKVSPKYCASVPKEFVESTLAFIPVLKKMGYISRPLKRVDIFDTKLVESTHKEKPHYDDPGKLI